MKLKKSFLLCIALIVSLTAGAQFREGVSYEELYDSETVASVKSHIRELSANHLEGRKAGSEGEKYAAEYVASRFKEYGVDLLSPADGEVFGIKTGSGDTLTSRNVVAYVQGYDKNLRDHYIVVGARLDNIGTSVTMVDGKPVERVYCGANGNASGTCENGTDQLDIIPPLGHIRGLRRFDRDIRRFVVFPEPFVQGGRLH